jgi:SNF2 family DNA or RNA helicase
MGKHGKHDKKHKHKKRSRKDSSSSDSDASDDSDVERKRQKSEKYVCAMVKQAKLASSSLPSLLDSCVPSLVLQAQRVVAHLQKGGGTGSFVWGKKVEKELGEGKKVKEISAFQDKARAKELQQKVQPFILRRTKKEVATELPEKTEMVVYCEMGKEQRRVYDAYKKEFQQYLHGKSDEELKSSSMHILQGLTKMRQICNTPALLSDNEYYGNQSAKLEELVNQVLKLQSEHKVLIFSQFVGMLELIKERLDQETIKYAYLTGKTRKRQEQVEAFQEDEEIRVFLISLKAGGTGLNLTAAEYVFIVDPWWNPAVENQAIDRAYRIGQANKVVAIRMITPDTIEEKIMELQDRKKNLVEELIHTDSGFFKHFTKNDLMRLV